MKKIIIVLVILAAMTSLVTPKVLAGNGNMTKEEAIKILQSVNPNIANYDMKTHLVTFKDGSKPIYVTPKGEHSKNGDVTWNYFIKHKGNLKGWFNLSSEEILLQKDKLLNESHLKLKSNGNKVSSTSDDYGYVNLNQYPQERCAWCGVAATKSVLSGWSNYTSQDSIASKEYGYDGDESPAQCDCYSGSGVSESAIAYALNGYLFNRWSNDYWYKVSHFTSIQEIIDLIHVDIRGSQEGLIFCGYTEHLPAWNGHHTVHYTAVYGYSMDSTNSNYSEIWYTDSANGLYKYCGIEISGDGLVNYKNLPAYNSCYLNANSSNSYYLYAYPYPAVG